MSQNVEWSQQELADLRDMWDRGMSTIKIGRALGRSRGSIVGKCHRLDLPGRPSPIKTRWEGHEAPVRQAPRAPRVTLAPVGGPSLFVSMLVVAPAIPFRTPAAGQCLWLQGNRPYVQCTEMALAGEGVARPWSYCQCHRDVAYVGRRFVRDEAA